MEIISNNIDDLYARPNYKMKIINRAKKLAFSQSINNSISTDKDNINIECESIINLKVNDELSSSDEQLVNNLSGWIRIYCGPDRGELDYEESSRVVHVLSTSTVSDVVIELNLPSEYTLWVQYGGCTSRRLDTNECPFQVQEKYLRVIGYKDESRRARLGISSDLKYLIRFHIASSEIPHLQPVAHSGSVEILKGLVFPQWKKRFVAIVGRYLYLYPEYSYLTPDVFDLHDADITEYIPEHNRLIVKIVPKSGPINSIETASISDDNNKNSSYSSFGSLYSKCRDQKPILFMGFHDSWERDMWSEWLLQAAARADTFGNNRCMDIGGSGLKTIPEIVLQSTDVIEELLAGHNKLQEIGLRALSDFPNLKVLRLPGNGFKKFPESILNIIGLTVLDLADNSIESLPQEIFHLENLQELKVDRNNVIELPNSIKKLKRLKSLQASENRLSDLPEFLKMKSPGYVDLTMLKSSMKYDHDGEHANETIPPLTKINLRANRLKGSIVMGNYKHLTQLDLSENDISILDLTALDQLESLQCSRNRLTEISINGRALCSLIAGNNELKKLTVTPVPNNLRHLDVSYNNLTVLPEWLSGCYELRILFANNNELKSLPDHLFCSERGSLHTLQLGYNKLTTLPAMPRRRLHLQELFIQNNCIEELPENFFFACEQLTLFNISSNRLLTLPIVDGSKCQLERLYATNNCLTDRMLDSLVYLNALRIIHLSYNRLTTFPESCSINWPDLEELVLSGNRLQHLPENLLKLPALRVLRIHSNQLQSVPPLSRISSLRVLDLAHNQLDRIELVDIVSKKLTFLDLSCNFHLQVDPKQVQECQTQRPMSLVDVSGKNRSSLPTTPSLYSEEIDSVPPWGVGFSETAGGSAKLYVSQLRLPNFCNTEGLFGIFDGEICSLVPNILPKIIPKILLEERTVKETATDYMKYTILSAHRELKRQAQKQGVSATLCHITRTNSNRENSGLYQKQRRYILRVASVGDACAYLIRQTGNLKLTPTTHNRQIGFSSSYPVIIPDPEICELTLGDMDEYLIIANRKLWEVMDAPEVSDEIRKEPNVILAAKRLQDLAQSYGAEENISVILIKLNSLCKTDLDNSIRDLRQTMKKKSNSTNSVTNGFCKCGCCCETNYNCCQSPHSTEMYLRQSSGRSDRSSPSGQSDQTMSELTAVNFTKPKNYEPSTMASKKSAQHSLQNDRRSLRGGVVRAIRAKIEEEIENDKVETESTMSEEQYKCWEYMLEQNTQLLFDKELNTISKAFTKRSNKSNLSRSQKALSNSTPQLGYNMEPMRRIGQNGSTFTNNLNGPFLSKHFGSARSFQAQPAGLFKAMRFNSNRNLHPIVGGPNAAYFGSLQRLMPYNLEYDFAVMQERPGEESLDPDSRMQQYWGVATTEL